MGSMTLISLEEYLHTTYRPDCDFLEGVVEERNLGEEEVVGQFEMAFL